MAMNPGSMNGATFSIWHSVESKEILLPVGSGATPGPATVIDTISKKQFLKIGYEHIFPSNISMFLGLAFASFEGSRSNILIAGTKFPIESDVVFFSPIDVGYCWNLFQHLQIKGHLAPGMGISKPTMIDTSSTFSGMFGNPYFTEESVKYFAMNSGIEVYLPFQLGSLFTISPLFGVDISGTFRKQEIRTQLAVIDNIIDVECQVPWLMSLHAGLSVMF
jgi:hypothetical protein